MTRRYYNGTGWVQLEVDTRRVGIRFREPAPQSVRLAVARTRLKAAPAERYEVPGEKFTVFPTPHAVTEAALHKMVKGLQKNDLVARATAVFRTGANSLLPTDRVIVGFRRRAHGPIHQLEARGFEIAHLSGSEYLVRLRDDDDPLQVATVLAQTPDVVFAEPDFVEYGVIPEPGPAHPAVPKTAGDPYAGSQWARHQCGADQALDLAGGAGDPAIRIAILDAGVDKLHPDLEVQMVGIEDFTEDPPPENPQDVDSHGTACAGLAAAIPNNKKGLRGFGGGCSILSGRVLYSNGVSWKMCGHAIARGIDWAICNEADVINLSLYTEHEYCSVAQAIQRALARGRGGKGCVVVAGTGNDGPESKSGVKFPAKLPGVIAVAATNQNDRPIDRPSDDSRWASAGGAEVALAAPGERHWTTDNRGKRGAVPAKSPTGDYMDNFDGTSSSAAIVAGTAALMLSIDPELTAAEVREILCLTAHNPDGLDPLRVGAGRLDAKAAVEEVILRRDARKVVEDAPEPDEAGDVLVVHA
jgi:thermitase